MSAGRVRMVPGIAITGLLLGLGVLEGIDVERMRFGAQRAARLERLEAMFRAYQATVMAIERSARADARDLERHPGSDPRATSSS
jgi:hypothetical protein